jgi:hypothetical protein
MGIVDPFKAEIRGERRRSPRFKCDIPVQIHPDGEANMWGKASDISLGGCFVEMPIPLKPDAKFEIALWLGETKLYLKGEVASAAPGFGIGVRFVGLTAADRQCLQKHIDDAAKALVGTNVH